jgi:DNA processing protein
MKRSPASSLDDRSFAALLLSSHLVERPVKPLKSTEFWPILDRVSELECLLDASADEIRQRLDATQEMARRVETLLQGATSFAFELEGLHRRGIKVVSALNASYPTRLKKRLSQSAPPVLYIAGPHELLSSEGMGIVGARDVSPIAASVTKQAAGLLASHGLTIYSGAAKGIDQIAMNSAFSSGGTVVGVLADSLEKRLQDPDTRRAITDDRVCLVTPYKPSMGFTVANAMGRNKIIYALAQATFVVQSDLNKGGTWAGATEWIKRHPREVRVWAGEGAAPGNVELVRQGAEPIMNINELLSPALDYELSSEDGHEQQRFGV